MKDNPPRELSRIDIVCRGLRRAIIEQALTPGDKLPENLIGGRFRVSRTIVRAALGRLHASGLVDIQPNKGATVAQPSLTEARDIFEARRCLERQVVARAAEVITESDIETLEHHVALEEQARDQDRTAAIRRAGEFHILLAELAGNTVLARYVDEVVSRCSLILALYGEPHSSECAVNEHQLIISGLKSRDITRVVDTMDRHLEAAKARALLTSAATKPRDLGSILGRYVQPPDAIEVIAGSKGAVEPRDPTVSRRFEQRRHRAIRMPARRRRP